MTKNSARDGPRMGPEWAHNSPFMPHLWARRGPPIAARNGPKSHMQAWEEMCLVSASMGRDVPSLCKHETHFGHSPQARDDARLVSTSMGRNMAPRQKHGKKSGPTSLTQEEAKARGKPKLHGKTHLVGPHFLEMILKIGSSGEATFEMLSPEEPFCFLEEMLVTSSVTKI